MSERIKNMTVQQLIDAGFKITLAKYSCGYNPALDAKQWMDSPVTKFYGSSVWATNFEFGDFPNPEINFYK